MKNSLVIAIIGNLFFLFLIYYSFNFIAPIIGFMCAGSCIVFNYLLIKTKQNDKNKKSKKPSSGSSNSN